MATQGTAVLDFGAFPGSNVAVVDVATAGVVSTSAVEAWVRPEASADHTDADHIAAPMKVVGQYLSDGNIRIYGINMNDVMPPVETAQPYKPVYRMLSPGVTRQRAPMLVGQFNVNWVWNT